MAAAYDGDGNRTFQLNYNPDAVCGYGKNVSGEIFMPAHSKNEDGSLTAEGELFNYICSATGRAYDLTEYVNDTNRQYTEVLTAYTVNSEATDSYSYAGNQRNSRNSIWTEARDVIQNETSFYLYDGRGSVTGVTWDKSRVTAVYQYDPYGQVTLGTTDHVDFYGYNGESYNPNTGLEYLRARYYNANQGRFFQEDTYLGDITDPLTLNRYAYVKNSPLNYVDPSGHFWDWFDKLFGGDYDNAPIEEDIAASNSSKDFERIIQGESEAELAREREAKKRASQLNQFSEEIKNLTQKYKKENIEGNRINLLKQMEQIMQEREWLCGHETPYDFITPIIKIPDELINLLVQLELSGSPYLKQNGVINHDVGDGGVTVGIGVYVKAGKEGDDTRKWLKDNFNVNADLDKLVDWKTVYEIFDEIKYKYVDRVNKLLLVRGTNNIKVSQQEFEAMFLLAYNTSINDLEPYLQQNETIPLDADTFARVMLEHYKTLDNWETYKDGWASRVKSAAYLFETGNYQYIQTTADAYLKLLNIN